MNRLAGTILKKIKTESTPLIDHDLATFVWRGRSAPFLVGDFTGWDEGQPVKLCRSEPGIWTYQLSLPADAYVEYGFIKDEETLSDPFNPRQTSNGVGGYNNYFGMPDYHPTELTRSLRHIPHGTISQFYLPTDYLIPGTSRMIYLYHPPVTKRVPLLVVWDGQEYLKRVRLNYIVDNLVAQGRMRPVAMAFVTNADQKSRTGEYACNDATLYFLMTKVMALAESELNLIDIRSNPGEFGIVGSSMGGLMALYTAARKPQVFGKVLSQSGAFSFGSFDMVVYDLLDQVETHPLKIWMDVGGYDLPDVLESNRHMRDTLARRGYAPIYREYNAGHNHPAWRDDIWRGLESLYGVAK
jgi:enterochelin esterase-like enzyme